MDKVVFLLLCGFGLSAFAEPWPGKTPVVEPQPDGVIALPAEAAGFVMNDRLGRHLMNAGNPKLTIRDGRFVNLGAGAQLPAWRFRVTKPGKYGVYLKSDTSLAERSVVRVSFQDGKREVRVVAALPRDSAETVPLGEAVFTEGTFEAFLMFGDVISPMRLPQVGEIRLIPAGSSDSGKIFSNPHVKQALSEVPDVRQAEEAWQDSSRRLEQARKEADPTAKPETFSTSAEFAAWDRLRKILALEPARLAALGEKLQAARIEALPEISGRLPDKEREVVEVWKAERLRAAEQLQKVYPKTIFPAVAQGEGRSLFPVGDLDKLPHDASATNAKMSAFEAPPPPDPAARHAAFLERDSQENLERLGRRLEAALRPDVPGLEEFYQACQAGKYEDALIAYRDYFFRKLKAPEKYGAEGLIFVGDFFQTNGKANVIRRPVPEWVEKNMEGIAVYCENGRLVEGRVGAPGSVYWAPASLQPPAGATYGRGADADPFWKTPEGRELADQINFYRALNRSPGKEASTALFPDLYFSYLSTGNVAHLRRFAEYVDDWTMNSVRDIDDCPVNVRAATEGQTIGALRALLRITLDERPSFAIEFPAPTLARLMMHLTETYHPYVVRAKRAELANWGIMGVEAALHDSLQFREFRAMDAMNREMSRLARINWIQHLSLGGEGLEAWDEGHMAIDHMLRIAPTLSRHGAPVMGDLETCSMIDHAKTAQRSLLTHFSPEGDYWVSWLPNEELGRRTIRGKLIPRNLVPDILDEAEPRRRFLAALRTDVTDRTMPLSDFEPYSQTAYLRDGFGPNSTSLFFQNMPVRSQNQGWGFNQKRGHLSGCMRTQFNVARDGVSVFEGSPVIVESKPPNIFTDLIPTGGKTDFCFQTPRQIQPGRFLSSAEFDVVAMALPESVASPAARPLAPRCGFRSHRMFRPGSSLDQPRPERVRCCSPDVMAVFPVWSWTATVSC